MFDEIQPAAARFRNHRAVASSVLAHLGLLAAILIHRPPVIELVPLSLAHSKPLPHRRPKPSSPKPAPDHLQVPADAIAADHNARAGSALGTMIDGPIEGHEVHVAYPVVFPDPPVARSELPRDLKGDVIVEVTIDAQGNVVETRVIQAIGYGIDEKIVAALRQWRYQPATLDGVYKDRKSVV